VTVGVLALQGAVREHVAVLRDLGVAHRLVRKGSDLEGLDGLIIPGGESTTMGLLMGEYGLLEPLRRGDLPVFGTCAGMIVMAARITDSDQPRLGLLAASGRASRTGSRWKASGRFGACSSAPPT
jgi:5'-phosphate synthase pdxT subunit